ncbi:MAG TPA: DUF3443 domain-containing protein [Steroidobacteraceae bacterium]|nr:DUF3443 domain-containing protein [Steroidobacteraceae bacterium]
MHTVRIPVLAALALLASCGGSGSGGLGSSGGGGGGTSGPNTVPLTVEIGPAGPDFVNIAFVTLTICAPGTQNCQTIDHIQVDTGSSGLRIVSSVLNASLLGALPQQYVGGTSVPVVECAQFADGYSWGPVVSADLEIGSETASGIPIQLIGNPNFIQVPPDCSSPVPVEENTVADLGANGIIGIGVFAQDCGANCANAVVSGTYYECPPNGAGCTGITEPVDLQLPNPVAAFGADNNGVIVELPGVAANGAVSATGALVFGIGTQTNNALGTATVLATDGTTGALDVTFGGTDYPISLLDSGSSALIFNDNALSVCPTGSNGAGFYCTPANLSATITTASNMQLAASFSVGNAGTMLQQNLAAYPQLAAPLGTAAPQTFDFGLPYFYNRNVFVAIEGMNAGGATGPFFAY